MNRLAAVFRLNGLNAGSIILMIVGVVSGWVLGYVPIPGLAPPSLAPSNPKSAAADVAAGKRLADAGDFAGAYAAFDRATKADASNAYAWANLGAAAAKLGNHAEATRAYERSLSVDPDNWLAHYNRSCALARAGKHEEALVDLKHAVSQLRLHIRSPDVDKYIESIRTDESLKELRNDRRFTAMLAAN